jgi:hypothetical protein
MNRELIMANRDGVSFTSDGLYQKLFNNMSAFSRGFFTLFCVMDNLDFYAASLGIS